MNYIIFMPDEMRAESLACYGNETVKTPYHDQLASEGVRFEQCHVQNTVCSPSRCCLFSGQYVHVAGHRTLWNLLKPWEPNLAKYLKDNGYDVRIYGKNDLFAQATIPISTEEFVNKGRMMPKKLDTKEAQAAMAKALQGTGKQDFLFPPREGDIAAQNDVMNVQAGIDFIQGRKAGDKPFFLFLALSWPHCPYTCFEPYYSMYMDNIPELRGRGENKPTYHELIRYYRDLNDQEALKKIQAVYLGMITFMDEQLGRVMQTLKDCGLEDETMLIATSDHGDYAGDYGLVEKWPNGMEDVLTRVPLIIRKPGNKAGHVVREQVEMFDIMATIMQDAGIEPQHTYFAQSLLPQLAGAAGDPDRAVFCEGGYNTNEPHCSEGTLRPSTKGLLAGPSGIYYPKAIQQHNNPESVCRATMMRTLRRKLVMRTDSTCEFYDLEKDPKELVNRYDDPAYQGEIAVMKERMLMWYINTSDVVPFVEDPRG